MRSQPAQGAALTEQSQIKARHKITACFSVKFALYFPGPGLQVSLGTASSWAPGSVPVCWGYPLAEQALGATKRGQGCKEWCNMVSASFYLLTVLAWQCLPGSHEPIGWAWRCVINGLQSWEDWSPRVPRCTEGIGLSEVKCPIVGGRDTLPVVLGFVVFPSSKGSGSALSWAPRLLAVRTTPVRQISMAALCPDGDLACWWHSHLSNQQSTANLFTPQHYSSGRCNLLT